MSTNSMAEGSVGQAKSVQSSVAQLAIVGFDGSDPSLRALDAAVQLLGTSGGQIEVVFVAHTPGAVALSPGAQGEVLVGFEGAEHELEALARTRLEATPLARSWSFARRDGIIAEELITAAEKARSNSGGGANVVIVVGAAGHRYHHVIGSVPVALVRHAAFPILVAP